MSCTHVVSCGPGHSEASFGYNPHTLGSYNPYKISIDPLCEVEMKPKSIRQLEWLHSTPDSSSMLVLYFWSTWVHTCKSESAQRTKRNHQHIDIRSLDEYIHIYIYHKPVVVGLGGLGPNVSAFKALKKHLVWVGQHQWQGVFSMWSTARSMELKTLR